MAQKSAGLVLQRLRYMLKAVEQPNGIVASLSKLMNAIWGPGTEDNGCWINVGELAVHGENGYNMAYAREG